jgi:hypothetical protein
MTDNGKFFLQNSRVPTSKQDPGKCGNVDSLTKLLPDFRAAKVEVLQVINHAVIPLIRRCTHVVSVHTQNISITSWVISMSSGLA